MIDANGTITDYTYNANGTLNTATLYTPGGGTRVTTFAFNNDRQITDIIHPNGRIDRLRYNAAGRLIATGNALNEFVSYGYSVATNTETTSSARKHAEPERIDADRSARGQLPCHPQARQPATALRELGQRRADAQLTFTTAMATSRPKPTPRAAQPLRVRRAEPPGQVHRSGRRHHRATATTARAGSPTSKTRAACAPPTPPTASAT